MKKILLKSIALTMALGLFACGNNNSSITNSDDNPTIKVGLICIGDVDDRGYTYNFIRGKNDADALLKSKGINVDWEIKYNVSKGEDCEAKNEELAKNNCKIIINNSFDFEPDMIKVAKNYPDTTFINCTNSESSKDDLKNTHNVFASIHEGRYLAGVVAGMKMQSLIEKGRLREDKALIGYVGAFPYAEVKSGYSAYYLGAKSACPSATMKVKFVNSWNDPKKEGETALELCQEGAIVVSQHSDSFTPATIAESKGAYHTGYNNDMIGIAPKSALISTRIDWSIYFAHAIETIVNNNELEQDWCHGMDEGAVKMTSLNEKIAADGTKNKINEVKEQIKNNTLHVFDTSKFTVNGEHLTHSFAFDTDGDGIKDSGEAIKDGYYQESTLQSSPYFDLDIDGITIIE